MPQTIKEYLEQVRAAGGTPTFTNIGGQNPMLKPGPGRPMGGTQVPGAYFIQEPGGNPTMNAQGMVQPAPPAIPEPEPASPMAESGRIDPYEMANKSLKKLMPEVWEQVFPGLPPGTRLNDTQRKVWMKAVASVRNAMVDRYKYQADQIEKDKLREQQEASKNELSPKELLKEYNKHKKDFQAMKSDPITATTLDPNMTADQYARQEVAKGMEFLKGFQSDQGQGALPTPGQDPAMQDGMQAPGMGAPMPMQTGGMMPQGIPDMNQFRQEAQALIAQHGAEQAKRILAQKYPGLGLQ